MYIDDYMGRYYHRKVWKIIEVGDYSLVLCSIEPTPHEIYTLLPNPTEDFISKHGRYDYGIFVKKYSLEPKEFLHTPETLILYFTDKVPEWAEVGMEVIY